MKPAKVLFGVAGLSVLFLTSCSKLGELSADNFTVTPNPLVESASKVPATIDGRFPVKYMKKKAVVTVTSRTPLCRTGCAGPERYLPG